jgi:hypothetical protein
MKDTETFILENYQDIKSVFSNLKVMHAVNLRDNLVITHTSCLNPS